MATIPKLMTPRQIDRGILATPGRMFSFARGLPREAYSLMSSVTNGREDGADPCSRDRFGR